MSIKCIVQNAIKKNAKSFVSIYFYIINQALSFFFFIKHYAFYRTIPIHSYHILCTNAKTLHRGVVFSCTAIPFILYSLSLIHQLRRCHCRNKLNTCPLPPSYFYSLWYIIQEMAIVVTSLTLTSCY